MEVLARRKPVVGLDVGSSAVKAVVLKGVGKTLQLVHLGIESLPPGVIVDGAVMDSSVIVDAIRKLFSAQKIRSPNVAIAVSGHAVIVKKITLPQMTRDELEESIRWEAEQYIPFDIDDVNIDFHVIEEEGEVGSAEMDVILVAVKKEKINDYTGLVRQAGLNPVIVDVDGFAMFNQFEFNTTDRSGQVALIDIGASVMNINILQDGEHMLYRDISIGGNQYTDAVQKELNVSFDQAEGLKMGEELKGIRAEDVDNIIQTVSEEICLEIQRSFDYFKATSPNAVIDKIVLTGGASKTRGLERFLADKLGVEVTRGNPFANIQVTEKKFDPVFVEEVAPLCAVAVGLALRRD